MSTVEVTEGIRGTLVKLGLAQPSSRAFVIGVTAAGLLYLAGQPKASFREDGTMKPLRWLSPEPDATTTHFLLLPVGAAVAGYLFT